MNTKFSYLYRDASNYKNYGEVIFFGGFTPELQLELIACLDEGRYFIAHQINIPEVFFNWGDDSTEDDHCWHEFSSLQLTMEPPTDDRTINDFIRQVKEVTEHDGWEEFNHHLGSHL